MTGIYKITNPNGKVYIGQSVDIERRWRDHKKNYKKDCNNTHLYNSFKKYGVNKHKFDVIEECKETELNKRERYYQEKYNVLEDGLNSLLTSTKHFSGRLSENVKKKISSSRKGQPNTDQQKKKISKSLLNVSKTDEHRNNISKGKMGYKMSETHKKNMINIMRSPEMRQLLSEKKKKWWADKKNV